MKEHGYSPEQLRELLSCTLEEPEVVTMKMKETYETIRANEDGKKAKRNGRYKRIAGVAAAAAAVAVVAATPVMAKGIGKAWDAVTAAIFGADGKVQESYENTGLSQTFDTPQKTESADGAQKADAQDTQALPTATVDGMTLSLKQVLTDGYMLYLNVDVEAPEGIKIDDRCLFDSANLLVDGKSFYLGATMAMNASFVEDEYAVSENHRAYEVVYNVDGGINLDGKHLALRLQDFLVDKGKLDMETKIAGVWTLEWDMGAAYHGKTVTIDLAGGICGEHAELKSVEITPLSYTLYYDYNGTDMELFDDSLWVEFVTKDGKTLNERGNQDSIITGNGGVANMEYTRESFVKILDVDELAGVRIDGVTYPVK